MASGKSTIGRLLSNALNKEFIDLDALITKRSGMTVPEVFAEYGESTFRQLESSALFLSSKKNNVIIATGGGTPCFYDGIERMKSTGTTIYLKLSEEVILKRLLQEKEQRPLVAEKSEAQLKSYIQSHLATRASIYETADHVIDGGLTAEEIVNQLKGLFADAAVAI